MKRYCALLRSLHLYFGLFITPFVLIFSISVLVFNHPGFIDFLSPIKPSTETRTKLDKIPYDTTDLLTAKAIIEKLEIEGEIDFINQNDDRISFPVKKPGLKTQITVNKHTDSVLITQQNEGAYRALTFLHSMPGAHNVKIRGNSSYIQVWRVLADVVVYLLLFLTISGVFLWYFLKVERNFGFFSIALGLIIFTSLLLIIF
ncbi:MAG: PepSY-associated TM helix domain-containing protein [Cyclobacteriaceae bacterium]